MLILISPDDLKHVKHQYIDQETQQLKHFRFPVAFAANLQQVVILRTVIRLQGRLDRNSLGKDSLYASQEIDLSPSHMPRLNRPYEEESYPTWFRVWVSPDDKYLAFTKRRGKPEIVRGSSTGLWSVTIWRDELRGERPLYQPFREIYVNNTNLLKDGYLAFHPKLPLLVVSGDIETIIWSFGSGGNAISINPFAGI